MNIEHEADKLALELIQETQFPVDGKFHRKLVVALKKMAGMVAAPVTPKNIREFGEELSDAYSTDHYAGGWGGCIRMLRKRGYGDREIEAIIRSKWTRWAMVREKGNTSADLAQYMDANKLGRQQVEELTKEHYS